MLTQFSYIFTDFQTMNESDIDVAKEYEEVAKRRGCSFFPIILECDLAENDKRMQSIERIDLVAGGKGMLLDTDILHVFRKRGRIFRFETLQKLELDVTYLLPAQAAMKILDHVTSLLESQKRFFE